MFPGDADRKEATDCGRKKGDPNPASKTGPSISREPRKNLKSKF